MLSEKQLAERGAVLALKELKEEITRLYEAYPGLLQAERMEKRKQTMLSKYGTLNPHEAQQKAKAKEAKAKIASNGPKKSHHKKKVAAPVTEAEPLADQIAAAQAEALDSVPGGESAESIELVDQEAAETVST